VSKTVWRSRRHAACGKRKTRPRRADSKIRSEFSDQGVSNYHSSIACTSERRSRYRSGEGERTYHYESLTDALAVFKDDPLEREPGTKYAYTTFGYTLLGVAIEGARACLIQSICASEFSSRPECCIRRWTTFTQSYRTAREAIRRESTANSTAIGRNPSVDGFQLQNTGCGLVSTAEDLARFAITVQNGVLIKPETFEHMSRNQKTRDGQETGYGTDGTLAGAKAENPMVQFGMAAFSRALRRIFGFFPINTSRW